jgi:hypothetical protein
MYDTIFFYLHNGSIVLFYVLGLTFDPQHWDMYLIWIHINPIIFNKSELNNTYPIRSTLCDNLKIMLILYSLWSMLTTKQAAYQFDM